MTIHVAAPIFNPNLRLTSLHQQAKGTCLATFADQLVAEFGCTPDYARQQARRFCACPAAARIWPEADTQLSLA